jgi:flagellar protein FliL
MAKKQQEEDGEAKKGKGGLIVKLGIALALVGAGGGGAFAAMQSGLIGGGHEKEDNSPKLIRKGEEDPYAPPSKDKDSEGMEEVYGEGGSEYRTIYYSFSEDFTSNLKNSDALVQVSIAASTQRDGRVVMWMKKHELAIRSAILTVLADTPEEYVYSVAGKERLQLRLAAAINGVLKRREGFGGIDAVYFKTFIVQ